MADPVLLLDDDEVLINTVADALSIFAGRDCVTAPSLADLQQKVSEALGCEVAILDINLGAGAPNGLDACHWLRNSGFVGRVFFLTAHAHSHPLVIEAKKLQDATVLSKPINLDQLLSIVKGGP